MVEYMLEIAPVELDLLLYLTVVFVFFKYVMF